MMFDDIEETEAELIGHVKAACDALAFLQEVHLSEAVEAGPVKDEWVRHMTALNMARTRLAMAAEYLHDDLNHYNDQMIAAAHGEFPSIVELRRTTRASRRKGGAEP